MTVLSARDMKWIDENEHRFEVLEYNDPRAVALRAKAAKLNAKKQKVRTARAVETAAIAASFTIGQRVLTARNETGAVAAIDGQNVAVEIAGAVRKFNASFIRAA